LKVFGLKYLGLNNKFYSQEYFIEIGIVLKYRGVTLSPGAATLRAPGSSVEWGILSNTWSTTPPGPRPVGPRAGMWPIRTHIDSLTRNLHFPELYYLSRSETRANQDKHQPHKT